MESIGLLGQMGGKVGLGAALAWVFAGAARRLRRGQAGRPPSSALRVVETAALGPNRALHLVAVNGRALLIGAAPSRVELLADVTDGNPTPDCRAAAEPASDDGREGFTSMLAHLLLEQRAPADGAPPGPALSPPAGSAPPRAGDGDQVARLRAAAAALRGAVLQSSHAPGEGSGGRT